MNRKSFLRNCLMAAAISICPKCLLPNSGKIEDCFDGRKVEPYLSDEYGQWGEREKTWLWEANYKFGLVWVDPNNSNKPDAIFTIPTN